MSQSQNPTIAQKIRLAAKAAVGVFSERAATEAYGMLAGLYPTAVGPLPERGTIELLDGYRTMPWLRAVSYRVAHAVATTPWVLYRPAGRDKRERIIQRTYRGADRARLVQRAIAEQRLEPIDRHILLDALHDANGFMVGHSLFFVTQVHLDLPGDAFWIKERNGLGAPVGFWPIPPHWVKSTPTVSHPFFRVQWASWHGEIPQTEILWFSEPNPVNPYGRGSGLGFALADELETDEYAAKHEKATLLNRARPDLIVWPEESKFDSGQISNDNAMRLGEKWRAEHQGFMRAALPFFATRKLGVKEINTSFRDLQLTELRKQERDIILQVWGVPPEQLGIIENSNRSTIDASDYLMNRNVVRPRLDLLRSYLQERLIPEYDERLIIDYVSPVKEDKEFALKVGAEAPWAFTVDDWRAMAGREPLDDDRGRVHLIPSTLTAYETPMDAKEQAAAVVPPEPPDEIAPALPADSEKFMRTRALASEWSAPLVACKDAEDHEAIGAIVRAMADDPEDLPELPRALVRLEPAARRAIVADLAMIAQGLTDDQIVGLINRADATTHEPSAAAVLDVVPLASWAAKVEAGWQGILEDGFRTGVTIGAMAAGLEVKEPHPVFNQVNPEAVWWAHRYVGTLIREVSDATVAGVQASVATALDLGWGSRKLAALIRETIGLTSRQSAAVNNFAAKLVAQGADITNPKVLARVQRYAEAQRRMRALTIARTELAYAGSAGQQRLWDAALRKGVLKRDQMRKIWLVAMDERLEPRCEALAQEETEIDGVFSNGKQGPPDHPNCRCSTGLVRAHKALAPAPAVRDLDLGAIIAKQVAEGIAPFASTIAEIVKQGPPQVHVSIPEREVHVHVPPSTRTRALDVGDGAYSARLVREERTVKLTPSEDGTITATVTREERPEC